MREILFRGKRITGGEWMFGLLADEYHDADFTAILPHDDERHLYVDWEVDPATVGQYTGLKDKNGKRIFEGDIVVYDNTPYNAYGHRVTGVIVWSKWMWKCRYKEYESTYDYAIGAEDFFGAKSEVIGNIHDNPELLKGENHG